MAKGRKTHGVIPYTIKVAKVNTFQEIASFPGDIVEYVQDNGKSAVTIGTHQAANIANKVLLVVITIRYFNGFTIAM